MDRDMKDLKNNRFVSFSIFHDHNLVFFYCYPTSGETKTNIVDLLCCDPRRADILVATPGRLVDLLTNGGLKPRLSQLSRCIQNCPY